MFKISRRSLNYIVGALVGIGIGSFGGVGVSATVSVFKNSAIYTAFTHAAAIEEERIYGVYLFGDTAIIIPEKYLYIYDYDSEGNIQKIDAFGDNVVLFSSDRELSAYDKAYNFASSFVDEDNIKDYVDLMEKNDEKIKTL